jgi:UDP-glucose 4-epimerase
MDVLTTGAAGYLGLHPVKTVLGAGHVVVALDNLSRGHRAAVPGGVPFVEANVRDTSRVVG